MTRLIPEHRERPKEVAVAFKKIVPIFEYENDEKAETPPDAATAEPVILPSAGVVHEGSVKAARVIVSPAELTVFPATSWIVT